MILDQPDLHHWPVVRDQFEARVGVTYCRRCGRLLAADSRPDFVQPQPCHTVRVTVR